MSVSSTSLRTRQMKGGPVPVDQVAHGIMLRVRQVGSGRWCIERYAGRADNWFPLSYYMDQHAAFREANARRSGDGVILLCGQCGGLMGNDIYTSCAECAFSAFGVPQWSQVAAVQQGRVSRTLEVFLVVLAAALILTMGLIMPTLAAPGGSR